MKLKYHGKIGASAFQNCTSLTSIDIPSSVKEIGKWAFYDCTSLTEVDLCEDGVTEIGEGTFSDCYSLTNVTIPFSMKKIGAWAFYGCSSLTSVTIPPSVTSICEFAFPPTCKITTKPRKRVR